MPVSSTLLVAGQQIHYRLRAASAATHQAGLQPVVSGSPRPRGWRSGEGGRPGGLSRLSAGNTIRILHDSTVSQSTVAHAAFANGGPISRTLLRGGSPKISSRAARTRTYRWHSPQPQCAFPAACSMRYSSCSRRMSVSPASSGSSVVQLVGPSHHLRTHLDRCTQTEAGSVRECKSMSVLDD